ncbi:MAG: alpha/beta fold hydrolase [Leptolyngbya sp. IPPAS B-1204]
MLWTEQDLTTPITVAHQLLERIQQSKLVTIPEGFHEWVLLHPKEAAAIITNFINQVEEVSSPDLTN